MAQLREPHSATPPVRGPAREKWLILGIDRNGRTSARTINKGARTADTDRIAGDFVAVLSPDAQPLWEAAADALLREMEPAKRPAFVLLPWQPPARCENRFHGPVTSFACGRATFQTLSQAVECPVEGLCFALLDGIMNHRLAVDRLAVRQLPDPNPMPATTSGNGKASLIMAHRGRRQYLRTALRYISRANGLEVRPRIGLDEDDPDAYENLAGSFPGAQFFRVMPAGAGPYVVRQELARRSKEPLLVFHDSDDISCYDRFVAQEAEIRRTGCVLVGCHELRVDEILKEVTAIRFPLDVTAALNDHGGHRLWHPTTMIEREAFWASGGFSTNRRIANDTQFLLRAHFGMKIRNLDGFVYIRRKHPAALTVAPETSLDSPIRQQLAKKWLRDFERVKRGEIRLEDSSLWPAEGTTRHRLRAMPRRLPW